MAIPNTTPTPNELYNGEMKKMKDTELRVVLVVTRATLGWEEDKDTKMRKKEDWISQYQIEQKTGRSGRAISTAINNCVKENWIEARDENGNLLDTPAKRAGKKIFYRLGRIFLDKIETPEKSSEVGETPEKFSSEKFSSEKSSPYKRNTITKEKLLQNTSSKEEGQKPVSYGNEEINQIIEFLKSKLGGSLDGSQKENRRFAFLLLNRLKKDYSDKNTIKIIKFLIETGLQDKFHFRNITNFKYLFYNAQKIIQSFKGRFTETKYFKL